MGGERRRAESGHGVGTNLERVSLAGELVTDWAEIRILAQAIYREGVKTVAAVANPMALKRGIDKAVETIAGKRDEHGVVIGGALAKFSKPVTGEMIARVGTISANSDSTIGNILAEAMRKVGKDGVTTAAGFIYFTSVPARVLPPRTFSNMPAIKRRTTNAGTTAFMIRFTCPGIIRERLSCNALRPSRTHCSTFIGFMGIVLAVKAKLLNHGRVRGPRQARPSHARRAASIPHGGLGEALNIRLCTRVVRHVGDSFIRAHCSHEQNPPRPRLTSFCPK